MSLVHFATKDIAAAKAWEDAWENARSYCLNQIGYGGSDGDKDNDGDGDGDGDSDGGGANNVIRKKTRIVYG